MSPPLIRGGHYAIMAERGNRWTIFATQRGPVFAEKVTTEAMRSVVRALRAKGMRPNDARTIEPCRWCGRRIKATNGPLCHPCQVECAAEYDFEAKS